MYLTEFPGLSANCMYSTVNVYMIVNQWDATFLFFTTLKHLTRSNHNFIRGKFLIAHEGSISYILLLPEIT